jgi:hypothetical protein
MSSKRILVSEVAWPSPRRGSLLTSSTSSRTVCTPSPMTCGGSRRAAATSLSPTTSRRKSWPGRKRSTITSRDLGGGAVGDGEVLALVMLTVTPLPWLPSCGLTTTGSRSPAAAQASSASSTGRPCGTGTPAACSSAWSGPCPGRWIRRWRWCVDFGGLDAALLGCPSRTAPGCPRSGGGRECRAPRRRARWRRCWGRGARPRRARAAGSASARSKGVSVQGGAAQLLGELEGQAADLPRCIRRPPGRRRLDGLRGAAEGDRAAGLRLQAQGGEFQHVGHRDALAGRSGASGPWFGKRARRRASKPGRAPMAHSGPSQETMASMAVWRLHRLGPRRARMRETSMKDVPVSGRCEGGCGRALGSGRIEGLDAGADQVDRDMPSAQAAAPRRQQAARQLGVRRPKDGARHRHAASGLRAAGGQHDAAVAHEDGAAAAARCAAMAG